MTFDQAEQLADKLGIDIAHDCDEAAPNCSCSVVHRNNDDVGEAHGIGDARCAARDRHPACSHDIAKLAWAVV